MHMMGRAALTAALLLAAAGWVPPAAADVTVDEIPEPETVIETRLDFGDYRRSAARVDFIEWRNTPAVLDTLTARLRKRADVLALNPRLATRTITPGIRILYPPTEGDPGWLIGARDTGNGTFIPLGHGDVVPPQKYGTQLVAIRLDQLKAFRRRPPATDPASYCVATDIRIGNRLRQAGDPIAREERTLRIEHIGDGRIEWTEASVRRFDDSNMLIQDEEIAQRTASHALTRTMAYATIGFVGLLGLLFVMQRRLRAAR